MATVWQKIPNSDSFPEAVFKKHKTLANIDRNAHVVKYMF